MYCIHRMCKFVTALIRRFFKIYYRDPLDRNFYRKKYSTFRSRKKSRMGFFSVLMLVYSGFISDIHGNNCIGFYYGYER